MPGLDLRQRLNYKKKEVNDDDLRAIMGDEARGEGAKLIALEAHAGTTTKPSARVVLEIQGKEFTGESAGNGPVDASFKAVDEIIKEHVELEEFLVQAITRGSDDMGKVHVQVEHKGHIYYGFGADTDIITASVKAYLDALNKVV